MTKARYSTSARHYVPRTSVDCLFSSLALSARHCFRTFAGVLTASLTLASTQLAAAQEITLYENDFEKPNVPVSVTCGNSLDQDHGINDTYGTADYSFIEKYTVETVVLHDPAHKYSGQGTKNGDYAIGMLGVKQDDRLAFRFDLQGQKFVNVAMDVSSIDVDGCGGPFGVETPRFSVSIIDANGELDWDETKLDEKTLEGEASPDAWTFHWTRGTVALDASKSTDGSVILVFDLLSDGYAVLDNLKITASQSAAVGDRDEDGVEDSVDNCPSARNPSQQNLDGDLAGDACDPAPKDPTKCGDRSGDGEDDCTDWCETHDSDTCSDATGGKGGAGGGETDKDDSDDDDSSGTAGKKSSAASKNSGGCSVTLVSEQPGSGFGGFEIAGLVGLGAILIRRTRRRV